MVDLPEERSSPTALQQTEMILELQGLQPHASRLERLSQEAHAHWRRGAQQRVAVTRDLEPAGRFQPLSSDPAAASNPAVPTPVQADSGSASPAWLTITALMSLLDRREVSSREITEVLLRRIEQYDRTVNGYITVLAERALVDADAADQRRAAGGTGALLGIPLAVKDLCDLRGVPTTAGSRILRDAVADHDATVVEHVRQAGAVLLGKTHMAEFAYIFSHPDYGPSRTPWDTTRSAGGSSGGSGAVVAAGLAYGAIGTDTGGSIRGPAAACGITGHKPTYGLVSRDGVVPFSWSLDHVGPMTRSARDARLLLDVIAGADANAPAGVASHHRPRVAQVDDLRGRRFGVDRRLCDGVHPEVERAFEATLTTLREMGAAICDVQLADLELVNAMAISIVLAEAASFHGHWLRERPEDYAPGTRSAFEGALAIPAAQYVDAQRLRSRFTHSFQTLFSEHRLDVLIWPPQSHLPLPVSDDDEPDIFIDLDVRRNAVGNLTGAPSVAIPCGFTDDNLPLSVLLTGLPFQDDLVLRIAEAYQSVTNWHHRHPPGFES